jgi:hypothetical protein
MVWPAPGRNHSTRKRWANGAAAPPPWFGEERTATTPRPLAAAGVLHGSAVYRAVADPPPGARFKRGEIGPKKHRKIGGRRGAAAAVCPAGASPLGGAMGGPLCKHRAAGHRPLQWVKQGSARRRYRKLHPTPVRPRRFGFVPENYPKEDSGLFLVKFFGSNPREVFAGLTRKSTRKRTCKWIPCRFSCTFPCAFAGAISNSMGVLYGCAARSHTP